jgi:peptidylprolyl isomerase
MKFSQLFIIIFGLALLPFVDANTSEKEWRTPSPDNTVYMQTSEGLVIIELAPFIAPEHTLRFKNLVKEGFYDGLDFYRVIDGFVAQAGDN